MRVKELADLTGTTVRTIRYYHEIGLLEVPGVRAGCRDYDWGHVARLTRIRWLTRAGVRLSVVASILDEDDHATGGPVATDLRASLVELDEQISGLEHQRAQLRRMLAGLEAGEPLSPMPAPMIRFYDAVEQRCGDDPEACREVRREREFNELAFFRGDMPAEVGRLFEGLVEADLAESAEAFSQLAGFRARAGNLAETELDGVAQSVVDRLTDRVGPDLAKIAGAIDLDTARRAVALFVRSSPRSERRLASTVGDAILAALVKAGPD